MLILSKFQIMTKVEVNFYLDQKKLTFPLTANLINEILFQKKQKRKTPHTKKACVDLCQFIFSITICHGLSEMSTRVCTRGTFGKDYTQITKNIKNKTT